MSNNPSANTLAADNANRKRKLEVSKYGILFVLLLEITIFGIIRPDTFFDFRNLTNVLRQVSFIAIAGVGVAPVMLSGCIDLSIAAVITFSNVLCAYLMVRAGIDPALAVLITMVLVVFIGLLNGIIVSKTKMPPMIATIGMTQILQGIAYTIAGGVSIFGFPDGFTVIGQGMIAGVLPVPIVIMAVCLVFCWFLLNKTYLGRYFVAIGSNERAAELSGINAGKYQIIAYMLSAFFTGIAGIVMLSRLNSGSPMTGSTFNFDVLTSLVLGGVSISGGRGNTASIISGVLVIGILQNGFILMNVGDYPQLIAKGTILILAVGFDCYQANKKKVKS